MSDTLKGIMDVLNNPVVEPYSTEKVNGKNGTVEKIHIYRHAQEAYLIPMCNNFTFFYYSVRVYSMMINCNF